MMCPNVTSPEWKALVDKIGEDNAWLVFLRHQTIPDASSYTLAGGKLYFNLTDNQFKSIRTRSTEEIAAEVNPDAIVTLRQIKNTQRILNRFLDKLGDLGSGRKLNTTPSTAFAEIKDEFHDLSEALKVLREEVITSQEIFDEVKNSKDDFAEMVALYPELGYIKGFEDLENAVGIYGEIDLNFDRYRDFVTLELIKKGIRIVNNSFQQVSQEDDTNKVQDETEDVSIAQDEIGERYDLSSTEVNWKNSAGPRVRAFVFAVPSYKRVVSLGNVVSYEQEYEMGLPVFADENDVYQDLLAAGSEMMLGNYDLNQSKFSALIAALTLRIEARPYLVGLINKLKNLESKNDWSKLNEILTFASKSFNNETLLLYETRRQGNVVTKIQNVRTIDSNRDTVDQQVSRQWLAQHKESSFFEKTAEGLFPKEDKVNRLNQIIEEGRKKDAPLNNLFTEFFKVLGIEFTHKDVDYISKNIRKELKRARTFSKVFAKNGMLENIANSYKKSLGIPFEDQYGITDEKTSVSALARLFYETNPGVYLVPSSTSADGKQKYLYQETSFVEARKRDWATGRRNTVMDSALAAPNRDFWEDVQQGNSVFELNYFNGLREQGSARAGKVRKQFDDKQQIISMLLKHQQNLTTGTYINFTLSDKTTTVESKMTKEFFVTSDGSPLGKGRHFVIENGKLSFTTAFKKKIYNALIEPEINRILAVIKSGSSVNLENYDIAGKLFYIFPSLNSNESLIQFREDLYSGKATLEELRNKYETIVADEILIDLLESAESQINQFLDLGIIKQTKSGNYTFPVANSTTYLPTLKETGLKGRDQALLMIMDMKVNYINAQVKVIQFNLFDPALAFKGNSSLYKGKTFDQISVSAREALSNSTWDEFSKRAALLIAPGRQGNYQWRLSDGTIYRSDDYRAVTATDVTKEVNNLENVTTDGQEFVTLQEHIDNLYSEGKIPSDVWESIYNKIQKAGKGGFYTLSDEELKFVFGPTKPVQAGIASEGQEGSGLNRIDYVKTSRYPLIPEQEAGSERDKLRQWMEKNDIASLNFVSGKKVGRPKSAVTLFDKDGNFVEPAQEQTDIAVQTLSRLGLRTQQELPGQKSEITTVTQMNRTMFDGMLDKQFSLKGKNMNGHQAKDLKEQVRAEMFERKVSKMLRRLGDFTKNHVGLYNLFKEVILSDQTGTYSKNDLLAIELGSDGKFRASLELMGSQKLESLINSILTKNIKLKVDGASFVQVSSVGAKYTFSALSRSVQSGIIWTDTYINSLGKDKVGTLRYISKKDNKVQPAQVIVSKYIRDDNGNLIDLTKYVTEKDGVKILDTSKFSPELLQLIGTRIPNQSLPSTLPIEVAGFLPDYMENVVVVPDGVTGQMGSDFDVDKLYAYMSLADYVYAKQDEVEEAQNNINDLNEAYFKLFDEIGELKEQLNSYDKEEIKRLKTLRDELKSKLAESKEKGERKDLRNELRDINSVLNQFFSKIKAKKSTWTEIQNINAEIEKNVKRIEELTSVDNIESFKAVDYDISQSDKLSSYTDDQLSQIYRDLHWMALTHPAAYDGITGSIDKPEAKKKVEERIKLLEKFDIPVVSKVSLPLDFGTSIQRYNDNRSGKVGTGVFANYISAQADLQDKVLTLGYTYQGEQVNNPIKVEVNGKEVDLLYIGPRGFSMSQVLSIPKKRSIGDAINIQFSESVDNAKNQLMREFNWQDRALAGIGVLQMLTDQNGTALPVEFSMDLISQPAVDYFFRVIDKKQDSFGEYSSDADFEALIETKKYIYKRTETLGLFPTDQQALEFYTDDKNAIRLSPDKLELGWLTGHAIKISDKVQQEKVLKAIAKEYKYKNTEDLLKDYYGIQLESLNVYYRISDLGREMNKILGSIYPYTKGIGSNVFETMQKINQLKTLQSSDNFLGIESVAGSVSSDPQSGRVYINPIGEKGSAIKNSLILAQEFYATLFPISSGRIIQDLTDKLLDITGKDKNDLGRAAYVDLHRDVLNAIVSYLFTDSSLELFNNPVEIRDQLVNGKNSLGKRILDAQKNPALKRNGFLKNIDVAQQFRGDAYSISFKSPFGTEKDENAIFSGFYELVTSTDPEIRQLSKDLALWPFLTGDAGSLKRFIPADYYLSDPDFSKAISEITDAFSAKLDTEEGLKAFVTQIVQNDPKSYAAKFNFSTEIDPFEIKNTAFKNALLSKIGNNFSLQKVTGFSITLGDFSENQNLQNALNVRLSRKEQAQIKAVAETEQSPEIAKIDFKYPDYIHITDSSYNGQFPDQDYSVEYLYMRTTPVYHVGPAEYKRINILGYKNIKEFDIQSAELKSVIKDNNNVEDFEGSTSETDMDNEGFSEEFSEDNLSQTPAQPVVQAKVLEGDIFSLPGIPVITTNLGGVHGAGLAQAAKAKGLIKQGEGTFTSSDSVVTLPVKLKWSDSMAMNNNMVLLQDSLNGLVNVAKANPQKNYLLPLAGLGHGEGSVEEIMPLLINTLKAASNIQLVLPAEGVNLGRQGTVRKDATRENMPKIKAMLAEAGLLGTQPVVQDSEQKTKEDTQENINYVEVSGVKYAFLSDGTLFYTNNQGEPTKPVMDPDIVRYAILQRNIDINPNRVATLSNGSKYYLDESGTIYSLQDSTYGNTITSQVVVNRVMNALGDKVKAAESQTTDYQGQLEDQTQPDDVTPQSVAQPEVINTATDDRIKSPKILSFLRDNLLRNQLIEMFGAVNDKVYQVQDIRRLFNSIFSTGDPFYKELLKAVSAAGGLGKLNVFVDRTIKDPGLYDPTTRTIRINPELAVENAMDVDVIKKNLHDVMIHELMHHTTVHLLDPANRSRLNAEQLKWVKSLENLYNFTYDAVSADPVHGPKLAYAMTTMNSEGYMTKADKNMYYGLASVQEFVSMLMTSREFQNLLNNIEYTDEKSLFDRFMEIITNLIKALGFDVKDNSVLKEGLNNIINLMGTRSNNAGASTNTQKSIATREKQIKLITENFDSIIESLDIQTVC